MIWRSTRFSKGLCTYHPRRASITSAGHDMLCHGSGISLHSLSRQIHQHAQLSGHYRPYGTNGAQHSPRQRRAAMATIWTLYVSRDFNAPLEQHCVYPSPYHRSHNSLIGYGKLELFGSVHHLGDLRRPRWLQRSVPTRLNWYDYT